jgi:hypothetical protein
MGISSRRLLRTVNHLTRARFSLPEDNDRNGFRFGQPDESRRPKGAIRHVEKDDFYGPQDYNS